MKTMHCKNQSSSSSSLIFSAKSEKGSLVSMLVITGICNMKYYEISPSIAVSVIKCCAQK
jgi:hypothetical protein